MKPLWDLDEALAWLVANHAGECCIVLSKGIGFHRRLVYLGRETFEFAVDARRVQ